MNDTIRLLDVVALTVDPRTSFIAGRSAPSSRSSPTAEPSRSNSAIVTAALTSLSGCGRTRSWSYTTNRWPRARSPQRGPPSSRDRRPASDATAGDPPALF